MVTAPTEPLRDLALEQAADELFDHRIYTALARREDDPHNREVLERLASHERRHLDFWLRLAGAEESEVRTTRLRGKVLLGASRIFGRAFIIRWLERGEEETIQKYRDLAASGRLTDDQRTELEGIISDELTHEEELEQRLADERMDYLGAAVLGLNDALVELTGALTGLASSIADPHLIAFSGLVVGVAAAGSMAASNFLSVDIGGEASELDPGKAAAYTGIAYLLVVLLLVIPFFVGLDRGMALGLTWAIAVVIIAGFSSYSAILQRTSFLRRFGKMLALGLGVAVISFGIGKALGAILGIGV